MKHINYFFAFRWDAASADWGADDCSMVMKHVAAVFDAYSLDQVVYAIKEGLVVERKGAAMNAIFETVLVGAICLDLLGELGYDARLILYTQQEKRLVERVEPHHSRKRPENHIKHVVCTAHPAYTKLQAVPDENGLFLMGDFDLEAYVDDGNIKKYYTQADESGFGVVDWKRLLSWADRFGLRKANGVESMG